MACDNAKIVTNLFLYGESPSPDNKVSDTLIRPSSVMPPEVYTVNKQDFMTNGGGRFALGAQFELVDKFLGMKQTAYHLELILKA